MTKEDKDAIMAKAMEQFKNGVPLFGRDGAFHSLLEEFLDTALEAEMEGHLAEDREAGGTNRRNGKMRKTMRSEYGPVEVHTPRDRDGTFDPETVRKRETILAEGLADKILSLYASGQSTRDITRFIEENYGTRVSPETVSRITDRVLPEIQAWKGRPLESTYPVVWLDAVHYKVRNEGTIVTKAIYNVLAVDGDGQKELLGMYIGEREGARFWTEVLTDLKNRGVNDILIACVDGLKGFPEAISAIFPQTDVQLCVVHQIRGSMRYVSYKDRRGFDAGRCGVSPLEGVAIANGSWRKRGEGFPHLGRKCCGRGVRTGRNFRITSLTRPKFDV